MDRCCYLKLAGGFDNPRRKIWIPCLRSGATRLPEEAWLYNSAFLVDPGHVGLFFRALSDQPYMWTSHRLGVLLAKYGCTPDRMTIQLLSYKSEGAGKYCIEKVRQTWRPTRKIAHEGDEDVKSSGDEWAGECSGLVLLLPSLPLRSCSS